MHMLYSINCLESLPNEILFIITTYLSSFHLVQAFYGLNYRFDSIVRELARHFIISKDFTEIKFPECKPHIHNVIEKVCFDVQILPQIFQSTNTYTNLRSVIINCSDVVTVDLNVSSDYAENIIRSCLDVFHICNIFSVDYHNANDLLKREKNLVCTAITRLSINSCSKEALVSVCALAPNLTYLKIKQLVSSDSSSKLNLITQSSSLKQLFITATANRLNDMQSVGQFIHCYQSSLEQLTLEISLEDRPDEYYLERMFEPCRNLQKLTFAFNYWCEEIEEIDALHQFQTHWWLDSHQPSILIFCNNYHEIFIVSMPCFLDDYIWFPVDIKSWVVNKGSLDSSAICFPKQKCIRFANISHQSITLELVYFIGRIFQAPKQELSIPHGKFDSPDLLIEQLINLKGKQSLLPLVDSLDLNSCDLNQLDPKTLIIWLLLASNAKVLNICQGSTTSKIQLANHLQVLIEEDTRLKSVTNSIKEVHVFYMFDSVNYTTKQHICQMYSNIFRNPIIRR